MGQALYRKYRSKKLSEVVGQEHITTTLEHALQTGKISHAYLFTGPRGVGKTSIARILAHEINQLPYTDDSIHLDIIEIDAASNRRIDEIRDLRDKVNIAPTSAKYKVYIIDEVHMLTKEAFNALLKTLEEPPAHVVFVLATTDAHRLPETIISRTQRYTFKPVPLEKVVAHLRMIANKEGIKVTDDALQLIAAHGEGSFRDSISLLDQAGGNDGEIDKTQVQQLLGIPPVEAIQELADTLARQDALAAIATMEHLQEQGFQPSQIAKQLGKVWRDKMLANGHALAMDFQLLQKLLDVPAAVNPERYLEIVLLEFTLASSPSPAATTASQGPALTPRKPTMKPEPVLKPEARKTLESKNEELKKTETRAESATGPITTPTQKTVATKVVPAASASLDETVWPQILAALKTKRNTLYGIVRTATPKFGDGELSLEFSFAFHRKQVSNATNQKIICDIIKEITGQSVLINCIVSKGKPEVISAAAELVADVHIAPTPDVSTPAKPDISSISNIFGGAELLES